MIEAVRDHVGRLPYMNFGQACRLRDFLAEHGLHECLELGFYHGVSSAYIAAILRASGRGHLTTIDREEARLREPNVDRLLRDLDLRDWVTVHFEPVSYTWRLMRLIEDGAGETFDFCYVDGGHSWDVTGYAFFLVEKLVRPGGWILFDDLDWTFAQMLDRLNRDEKPVPAWLARKTEDELRTPQVRKVWELLVRQHPGFVEFREEAGWGFARKR